MAADVGRHSLAQRYAIQALDLAMAAGDRHLGVDVLACMSRLTVQIGWYVSATNDLAAAHLVGRDLEQAAEYLTLH